MSVFRNSLIGSALLCLTCLGAQVALADEYFDKGKSLFDRKQFRQALPYLHKAAEDSPWDATAAYYEALAYQYLSDWNNAKKAYRSIADRFPGTAAYDNAVMVLRRLDPSYLRDKPASAQAAAATPSAAAASDDDVKALLAGVQVTGPAQTKIPVRRDVEKIQVDGSINGSGKKFDFVGEETILGAKDAQAMRLADKSGQPAKSGSLALVTLKVGEITLSKFPVKIADTDRPKLGTDFLAQFSYTLEPSAIAVKRNGGGGGSAAYSVPFRKSGKNMIIDVQINGRRQSVTLDPDANECVVPKNRAKDFGLEISEQTSSNMFNPESNPSGPLRGEQGFGEIKTQSSAEGKLILGPITSSLHFKIDEKATEPKINASAFGGWKYRVDPAASMLRFDR